MTTSPSLSQRISQDCNVRLCLEWELPHRTTFYSLVAVTSLSPLIHLVVCKRLAHTIGFLLRPFVLAADDILVLVQKSNDSRNFGLTHCQHTFKFFFLKKTLKCSLNNEVKFLKIPMTLYWPCLPWNTKMKDSIITSIFSHIEQQWGSLGKD